jgi:hypothetical protein
MRAFSSGERERPVARGTAPSFFATARQRGPCRSSMPTIRCANSWRTVSSRSSRAAVPMNTVDSTMRPS